MCKHCLILNIPVVLSAGWQIVHDVFEFIKKSLAS